MQRYDLCYGRKNEQTEKTYWQKCGMVLVKDDGKISVKLEALPVGVTGEVWLSAFEPREKKD